MLMTNLNLLHYHKENNNWFNKFIRKNNNNNIYRTNIQNSLKSVVGKILIYI